MAETLKDKILKTLIDAKKLTKEEVDEAIALQKKKGIGLDKALIEKGHVKEQDLLALLVRELNIPFINLSKYKINPELQEIIPERIENFIFKCFCHNVFKIIVMLKLHLMLLYAALLPMLLIHRQPCSIHLHA